MPKGFPLPPLQLGQDEIYELEKILNSPSQSQGLAQRAKIVLACQAGGSNAELAAQLGVAHVTVGKWRTRYMQYGISGLHDALRPGRPRSHDDEKVMQMVSLALETKPKDGSTHWTVRSLAEETGVSKSTVHRWMQTFCLQPHRQRTFKLSNDPCFVEKVRDVVGLYLNPPDNALVLCVDEKTQIQALDRTQPLLPMGLGYVEGVTSNYNRHGTTTLFAALDVATGEVLTQCNSKHRHQEFLSFLRKIEDSVPPGLDVHLVLDNYCTHKHHKVRAWLAKRPRFHVHFTPTYSSWLNQVERWLGIITQKVIRRGSFSSVRQLIEKIEYFVNNYNSNTRPFVWTATADSIFEKILRLCERISGT
jgi:putative transposase